MAVSKQPSIPAETSSAEGLDEEASSRGEAKWKRFHPFRVVRKIFRRRIKREGTSVSDTSKKSWSTSELQSVQDDNPGKRDITSPLKIGLSVSHDSIFSPESAANNVGSEALDVPHGSSLSVHHTSINAMFKDELFTRVRARRDSDDDDVGLPHSPCNSPTTVDVLTQGLKEKSSKSQTTCSAGSLISMGSSENDEDSAGHSSGHSSKLSLLDRRSLDSDGDTDSSQPVPLNHNAAHHRIAVRPKRTYGLPRRRMNQIAAAKVSTLPSTPEVTEDNGKGFHKLDSVEVVKAFTEYSVSSLHEISSTKQSSEWQISQMTSSYSYSESPNVTNEVNYSREQSDSECGAFTKSLEDSAKIVKNDTAKISMDSNFMPEIQGNKNFHLPNKDMYKADSSKDKSHVCDLKPTTIESLGNEVAENAKKPGANDIPENKHHLIEINESLHNQSDIQIISSSLVRSVESSESFENVTKDKVETKVSFSHSSNEQMHSNYEEKADSKSVEGNNEKISKSKITEIEISKSYAEKLHEPLPLDTQKDFVEKTQFPKENISIVKTSSSADKLDIDNEFVLKTVQRNFNQDNSAGESSQLPALYFEEESLMSSKSLSMGAEESGIFVPHPASLKNNLGEMLVTEARNFAAVEENVSVFIQPSGEIDLQKKKENSEAWISSVNIPPSTVDSDITVNSMPLYSSKMTDDIITISVNRKSEAGKSVFTSHDVKQPSSDSQKPTVMPKLDVNQRPASKEKQTVTKPLSNNVNTNPLSSKNTTAQKRVSVEIVPFSQRMKERKYQPISYSNKEFTDVPKKNNEVTVERKLSDRKVVIKNKESDKSSSRHSFSGALISECKKGDIVIEKKAEKPDKKVEKPDKKVEKPDKKVEKPDKKVEKPEKVQYPVQIRIHKSNPKLEVKTPTAASTKTSKTASSKTHSTDIKFQMQATKSNSSDVKLLKEETNIQENATKWEVKIQPSVPHGNNLQATNLDEGVSSISSESNMVIKEETHKSAQPVGDSKDLQTNSEIESCSVISQENNWKGQKETPVVPIEEPEPELLRVFARRSIKQKHFDKGKIDESCETSTSEVAAKEPVSQDKTEDNEINIPDNSTVVKVSETVKPHVNKHDLKKKSKSFCEKEKVATRSVSPLREMNLIHRESLTKVTPNSSISIEALHPRQRLASVPDIPLNLPPDFQKDSSTESSPAPSVKEENLQRTTQSLPIPSGSANGSLTSIGMVKENQDLLNEKEPHAPSWLQLAQQRRELREQRERLLLGGSPNSFMDGSNKPSRSSKVWDMVNNFQKLQMT